MAKTCIVIFLGRREMEDPFRMKPIKNLIIIVLFYLKLVMSIGTHFIIVLKYYRVFVFLSCIFTKKRLRLREKDRKIMSKNIGAKWTRFKFFFCHL